jgi:polyisoprenyl-phosphate glycosyltransferase
MDMKSTPKKKSASPKKSQVISIAIPVYNEVENVPILYDHLKPVLEKLPFTFEIIFVDDGSSDGTYAAVQKLQAHDHRIKAISFSRNFGHQAALTAGLHYATGDAVITMDGDLQHPPALIPTLIAKWQEGNQVVFTVREATADESFFKKMTSKLFYRIMNASSKTPVQPFGADFRLLDRAVVSSLKTLEERDRFLRGLIGWLGFSSVGVPFTANARAAGNTKYSTRRMMNFALDGILSFSATPLHLVTLLGLIVSALSFVYGAYSLYAYFFTERTIPGWTSILVTVLFLGGVQLISIGILGEYLLRVYNETKRRPLFIIKDALNIDIHD